MPERELSEDVKDASGYLMALAGGTAEVDPVKIDHARRTLQACWSQVPRPTAPSYGPPEYSE